QGESLHTTRYTWLAQQCARCDRLNRSIPTRICHAKAEWGHRIDIAAFKILDTKRRNRHASVACDPQLLLGRSIVDQRIHTLVDRIDQASLLEIIERADRGGPIIVACQEINFDLGVLAMKLLEERT